MGPSRGGEATCGNRKRKEEKKTGGGRKDEEDEPVDGWGRKKETTMKATKNDNDESTIKPSRDVRSASLLEA